MGDSIRVQLPLQEIYFGLSNHPGELSLAIPPCMGRCNKYRSKGSDAVWLRSKGRYGSYLLADKTV